MSVAQALLKCVGKASSTAPTFTVRTATNAVNASAFIYENGICIMAGTSSSYTTGPGFNNILLSTDLVNWTTTPTPSTDYSNIRGGCFGNGLYVLCDTITTTPSRIITSPDGITWTPRTTSGVTGVSMYSGVYGNSVFVFVGGNAPTPGTQNVLYSTDGTTWSVRTTPTGNWTDVAFGNGVFVAINNAANSTSAIMTSTNGTSWNSRTTPSASNGWGKITFGNGKFVAMTNIGEGATMTSTDGITWTKHIVDTLPTTISNRRFLAYTNGLFTVVGSGGTDAIMTSPDGIAWQAVSSPAVSVNAVGQAGSKTVYNITNNAEPEKCVMTSP